MPAGRAATSQDERQVAITNPDKVLFPETGFTKGDVVAYYRAIAPIILPHIADRPITLIRYPDGVEKEFFYAKRCPPSHPTWMPTLRVPTESDRPLDYCIVNEEAALAYVANLAGIELHVMLYRRHAITTPTLVVFDLDPGEGMSLVDCCAIGLELRQILKQLGLECFPKSSGKKGLHLYIPLNTPGITFEDTKSFAHAMAELMEEQFPDRVTSLMRKTLRKGKIFIDWSQNDDHKTTVAPYSLRAQAHPMVSMPLTWREVSTAAKSGEASGLLFDAPTALKRVKKRGDLFAEVLTLEQSLPKLGAD